MRYLTIPGIVTPISRLALGSDSFALDNYERCAALLDTFRDLGGTAIDTGHVYGNGASEQVIGRWLREHRNRTTVVLIDKGCHPTADGRSRVTPEAIYADLSESLECLQTEYIDLYLLHRDDERVPVGPLIDALNEEYARGHIRAFGASNWRTERIVAANAYAAERQLTGFAASSAHLSLAQPRDQSGPGA